MQQQQRAVDELKGRRKETPRHGMLKELPETERFAQLRTTTKHFVDTIKRIAYRAETALGQLAREKFSRENDARALIREVFESAVDLRPDLENKTLSVRRHRLSTEAHDTGLEHLCTELNATETIFPGTELRLEFTLIGASQIPRGQES